MIHKVNPQDPTTYPPDTGKAFICFFYDGKKLRFGHFFHKSEVFGNNIFTHMTGKHAFSIKDVKYWIEAKDGLESLQTFIEYLE